MGKGGNNLEREILVTTGVFWKRKGKRFPRRGFVPYPHKFSTRSEAECGKKCGYRTNPRSGNFFPWIFQKTEVGYRFIYHPQSLEYYPSLSGGFQGGVLHGAKRSAENPP